MNYVSSKLIIGRKLFAERVRARMEMYSYSTRDIAREIQVSVAQVETMLRGEATQYEVIKGVQEMLGLRLEDLPSSEFQSGDENDIKLERVEQHTVSTYEGTYGDSLITVYAHHTPTWKHPLKILTYRNGSICRVSPLLFRRIRDLIYQKEGINYMPSRLE